MRDVLVEVTRVSASAATAAALVVGALVLVRTHSPAAALPALLDLLLVAGLLRLAGDPDWRAIATAAAIVTLRRLIGIGLRAGGRTWPGGAAGAGSNTRSALGTLRAAVARAAVRPAWRR